MAFTDPKSKAADAAIREHYDFGELELAQINWTIFFVEEDERSALVYFKNPEGEPYMLGNATVKFDKETDEIIEAYAALDGVRVGDYNPPSTPAPGF